MRRILDERGGNFFRRQKGLLVRADLKALRNEISIPDLLKIATFYGRFPKSGKIHGIESERQGLDLARSAHWELIKRGTAD